MWTFQNPWSRQWDQAEVERDFGRCWFRLDKTSMVRGRLTHIYIIPCQRDATSVSSRIRRWKRIWNDHHWQSRVRKWLLVHLGMTQKQASLCPLTRSTQHNSYGHPLVNAHYELQSTCAHMGVESRCAEGVPVLVRISRQQPSNLSPVTLLLTQIWQLKTRWWLIWDTGYWD